MSKEEFFRESLAQFKMIGPQISESEILAVFPTSFYGRDELVQFYLRHNGGSRTQQGGLVHCGNPAHRISRENLKKIKIERFFSIPHSPGEPMHPFTSMLRHYTSRLNTFRAIPEMADFLKRHRPIASDHTGNGCWINTEDGQVQFVHWETWREGPIRIARSFNEFVDQYWNVPPERVVKFDPPCGLDPITEAGWLSS